VETKLKMMYSISHKHETVHKEKEITEMNGHKFCRRCIVDIRSYNKL